jgi:hypothetical protein
MHDKARVPHSRREATTFQSFKFNDLEIILPWYLPVVLGSLHMRGWTAYGSPPSTRFQPLSSGLGLTLAWPYSRK